MPVYLSYYINVKEACNFIFYIFLRQLHLKWTQSAQYKNYKVNRPYTWPRGQWTLHITLTHNTLFSIFHITSNMHTHTHAHEAGMRVHRWWQTLWRNTCILLKCVHLTADHSVWYLCCRRWTTLWRNTCLVWNVFTSADCSVWYLCCRQWPTLQRNTCIVVKCVHFSWPLCIISVLQAMADIVKKHLHSGEVCSPQLGLRCPMCVNATCGMAKEFFASQQSLLEELLHKSSSQCWSAFHRDQVTLTFGYRVLIWCVLWAER